MLVYTALEPYIYYKDTDRGLKNITIFQNFLVGACPRSKRAAITSLYSIWRRSFFIPTFIKMHYL